jgi:UDPglucose 6-dehydrogenase
MKLTIIGSGYVGLVTGACFADVGHHVICVDNNQTKVEMLRRGEIPIYEPGLEDIIHHNVAARRLSFTTDLKKAVQESQIIFIAVPTPPQNDGSVDLSYIEGVALEIAKALNVLRPGYRVIVDKSTVPVKTGEKVAEIISGHYRGEFDVVSNPEFLREGSAVADLMKPDRIVIGSNSERALTLMKKIYEPFLAPIMVTDVNSAELIKHAANSFLSLKISFINVLANICEASNADVEMVADGIGADKRIGRAFLNAGLGYGGSCFPKDVSAFIAIARELGEPFHLLEEVEKINDQQWKRFVDKAEHTLRGFEGKRIAVWGLTFKPDTDDIRCSVPVKIIDELFRRDVGVVAAYDPQGMANYRRLNRKEVELHVSPEAAAINADALILATEWKEFQHVDLEKVRALMASPAIFDGRNFFNPEQMRQIGFVYHGVGRK